MPSPFSGAMNYMMHREALREQIRARMQMAAIAEQQRRDQLNALNLYRQQLMGWRGQQAGIAQQKSLQKQAEDRAFVQRVIGMKDDEVDPPVRAQLHALQAIIKANPNDPGMAALAQDFVKSKSKPSPIQFKTGMGVDPTTMLPMTYGFTVNPRAGMSASPAKGSLLASSPLATPSGPSIDEDASGLVADYGLGGP